ncbi:MAG: hypothetical protein OXG35_32260 [Acidobacteria bacterium]|nr:hypothetical protein [Acidobacteriota bacterium]
MLMLKETDETTEALTVVKRYVESFQGHADGRVNNGSHHLTSDTHRLAAFAVKLSAELLIRYGLVDGTLSWLEENDSPKTTGPPAGAREGA